MVSVNYHNIALNEIWSRLSSQRVQFRVAMYRCEVCEQDDETLIWTGIQKAQIYCGVGWTGSNSGFCEDLNTDLYHFEVRSSTYLDKILVQG